MHILRRIHLLRLLVLLWFLGNWGCAEQAPPSAPPQKSVAQDEALTPGLIKEAFRKHKGNLMVADQGHVVKVLPDDTKGSRHQRFIIKLASGQRLLVAHNIDLAPRVAGIRAGDQVTFRGEYEWNHKGGVIHWTHHDPRGRHPGGWIRHAGKVYQ